MEGTKSEKRQQEAGPYKAKQAKSKEKEQLHSAAIAMIPRQHPTITSSARMSIISVVAVMTALLSSLSLVSSFGTQSHFNTYHQRRTTHHEITTTHWPFSTTTTRLFAAENEKWKSESNSFQRKIRISAANHQTSMKWVVESIEKVLQDETRRGGTGSKNSPEDDEALMDALNKMQRGAFT